MKKIIHFLTHKRLFIFSFMMLLLIGCAICIPFTKINYDMSNYLPNNSNMKEGLNIMEEEFGKTSSDKNTFKIMFEDLDDKQIDKIYEQVSITKGVENVMYQKDDIRYNADRYTLFVVQSSSEKGKDVEKVMISLANEFTSYNVFFYYGNIEDNVMRVVIPITAFLMIIILLLICDSYLEPFIIIINISVAVILNMGTNIIFSSVSDMTYSIAAVLQAVLSIDYSIILINRYKQEKQNSHISKIEALSRAIKNSYKSIIGSSFTTIIGLVALLFMSFTIGRDLGLVISKGVLFSLITTFTILPTIIIMSDKYLNINKLKTIQITEQLLKTGEAYE